MPTSPADDRRLTGGFRSGLGSYAFRWAVELSGLDAPGVLERSAALGAEVVQLCDNLPVLEFTAGELADLRAQAGDLGLGLETGMKGGSPERLRLGLRSAKGMGSQLLRVVLAGSGWEPSAAQAEAAIRDVLPALHGEGIALAVENHFDLSPTELAAVIESIGDPLVGVCLDPFNSISHLVGPAETVRLLAKYAISVHVKDARASRHKTGFIIRGCPVGEGALDLPGMLAAVEEAGQGPAFLLESWMDRMEDDAATCAQEETWNQAGLETIQLLVKRIEYE